MRSVPYSFVPNQANNEYKLHLAEDKQSCLSNSTCDAVICCAQPIYLTLPSF